MYEFAWRSPQFGGRLGAAHGVEMPFVFDTLGPETEPMLGQDPPHSLAIAMHAAWVSFALSGDCGWPKYEACHRVSMRFDTVNSVVRNSLAAQLDLWNGVR
jgi:carboxylesterase type B